MKKYGKTRSTVMPEEVEYTETNVFVASNIQKVNVQMEEGETQEYEFNLTEYTKDEYIQILSDKNESLESEVTDTQVALCEVYELMV